MKTCPTCKTGTLRLHGKLHPVTHQLDEESRYYECANPRCGEEFSPEELSVLIEPQTHLKARFAYFHGGTR